MEIKKFRGLRNTTDAERFKPGDLESAVNMDVDDTGKVRTRDGHTQVVAGASHSMWGAEDSDFAVFVQSGSMYLMFPDESVRLIRSGLVSNRPMAYAHGAGVLYFSNGVDRGRIVNGQAREWGVTPPVSQPVATAAPGMLPPGTYQYAMTFVRSDGHESGTGLAGVITLPTGGGIDFSSMEKSTNPEVSGKILYLSSPNGEVLYRGPVVANSVSTYQYRDSGLTGTVPLTTQMAGPPPPATMLGIYNGVLYAVVGNAAYYSDPYNFELFRLAGNFLQMPAAMTLFEPMNNGIYVGTDDVTAWLGGNRPDSLEYQQVFDYGVLPYTGARLSDIGTHQEDEPGVPAVLWMSKRGVCMGLEGGAAKNLTEARYVFPTSAPHGAAIARKTNGIVQYLAVLQGL